MKNQVKNKNPYNLPTTRFQLFFDVIKQNWRTIILIGLFLVLFALPSIVSLFVRDYYISYMYLNLSEGETLQEATLYGNILIYGIFSLSLLILCIGVSGLSKVILELSYEEGFSFFGDFKDGLKKNLKTNILTTLIYIVLLYTTLFISASVKDGFMQNIPLGICQGIAFPILLVVYSSNTIYDWKFKDSLRNGAIIYIRYFLFILLFSLLLTAVFLLNLIPNIILRYVVILLYLLIIEPFIMIGFVIYMNHCFDEGINRVNYPKLYRKGLFQTKEEIAMVMDEEK